MNGLEISRSYYEIYGKPMLEADFPELIDKLAVGFVGSGSEHYGFDDRISQDHDFEPGFCIFLPGESVVDRRNAFLLERAYAKLPNEFCGLKRQTLSPVGGNRNGVLRISEFYESAVGSPDGILSEDAWLRIPDYALAEATNGAVFEDRFGAFSAIRSRLMHMPEDIRKKRLAGNLMVMAQAGQYNFSRCLQHHEPEAAQLACVEMIQAAMKVAFLLHHRYMPFYKWSFRALRQFDAKNEWAPKLSDLLCTDATVEGKSEKIEELAGITIQALQAAGLTLATCGDLEKHAYSVNDTIQNERIRNMNIFAAV